MHTGFHVIPQSRILGHPKNFDNQAFEARHKPNKQGGICAYIHTCLVCFSVLHYIFFTEVKATNYKNIERDVMRREGNTIGIQMILDACNDDCKTN